MRLFERVHIQTTIWPVMVYAPHCFPSEFYTHKTIYQITFMLRRGHDIVRLVSLFLGSCKRY